MPQDIEGPPTLRVTFSLPGGDVAVMQEALQATDLDFLAPLDRVIGARFGKAAARQRLELIVTDQHSAWSEVLDQSGRLLAIARVDPDGKAWEAVSRNIRAAVDATSERAGRAAAIPARNPVSRPAPSARRNRPSPHQKPRGTSPRGFFGLGGRRHLTSLHAIIAG